MTRYIRFCCKDCGHYFEALVFEEEDEKRAEKEGWDLPRTFCPQCQGTNIRYS